MKICDAKSSLAIGFLTVAEYPEHGLFGGYLVLNRLGRPLEFHCTAPIKPSRAQQILYGPTLQPYLYGEQIGRTLVASAKAGPLAVFTDREPALALRELVEVPVVFVLDKVGAAEVGEGTVVETSQTTDIAQSTRRLDPSHAAGAQMTAFHLGRNRLAVPTWAAGDCQVVTAQLGELAESFDLLEPFERIREAIEEARRGG
jgi:hypothetical protein